MAKVKNRILGLALVGIMSLTGVSSFTTLFNSKKVVNVQAAEYEFKSKEGKLTYDKIMQIIDSIDRNYAGVKNQATWQGYIKEARELMAKIPAEYNQDLIEVARRINWLEHFVNFVANVNQAEKSYNENYKGIKNVPQWSEYLKAALKEMNEVTGERDSEMAKILYKVNDTEKRYNNMRDNLNEVVEKYLMELKLVRGTFNYAVEINSLEEAKKALEEANKLGTIGLTTELKEEIIDFINNFK